MKTLGMLPGILLVLLTTLLGCQGDFNPLLEQQLAQNSNSGNDAQQPLPNPPTPPPETPEESLPEVTPPSPREPGPLVFNVILRQTNQPCGGCGIFFHPQGSQSHNPRLEVTFEYLGKTLVRNYQDGLGEKSGASAITITRSGNEDNNVLLIKQTPGRHGLFMADLTEIPGDAKILRARLHLHLHTHEGMSYDDTTSELSVHHNPRLWKRNEVSWTHYDRGQRWPSPGGEFGEIIRTIQAKRDIIDRGFHKHSPNAHFDFTAYVQELQKKR